MVLRGGETDVRRGVATGSAVEYQTTEEKERNALSEESLITQLSCHSDLRDTVIEYDRIAAQYDEEFPDEVLTGPRHAAEAVLEVLPADGPVPRGQLRVIDVAAGTGAVGKRLFDAGLTNLDALEPSAGMIKFSKRRGIYQRIIQDVIGTHRIDVEDNTYDVVVVAGAFLPGHIPISALDEMIRICKPGGYIINTMRMEFLFTTQQCRQLIPHMASLEEQGQWRQVKCNVFDGHFKKTKQGITFIYQKL